MSVHTVTAIPFAPGPGTLYGMVVAQIREPASLTYDPATDTTTYTFTPDLTAAETQLFADFVGVLRQHAVSWTLAEYQSVRSQIVEIRAFRQRTLAQWNALTVAQREGDEISYLNDLTDVLRALLRQ